MIVKIYGEMHNHFDDVKRIRDMVVEQEPDVVLHELYDDDREYYAEYGIKVVPLEPVYNSGNFYIRELTMLIEIYKSMIEYKNIAVVIGDTHIRSQSVDDLKESPIRNYLEPYPFVEFIRSPYKELS